MPHTVVSRVRDAGQRAFASLCRSPPLRGGFGALAVASLLVSSPVLADAPGDAKGLFAHARDLRLHDDCANAVPLFRKAYEIYPAGLGSLRNLAECEESLGHLASARHAWLDLQRALATHNETRYEGWATDAREGASRLAPKLATLTVDVEGVTTYDEPFEVADIYVELNGERLQPQQVGTPVDRDPGGCVVVVRGSAGFALQERFVDLLPGDAKRVSFRVVLPATSASERAALTPAPAHRPGGPNGNKRTAAWISMGIGGASAVGAGIAAIAYQGALVDLDSECPMRHCDPSPYSRSRVEAISERGRTASILVNVFVVAGVVGLGTGIVLLATRDSSHANAALIVSPMSVSATGTF